MSSPGPSGGSGPKKSKVKKKIPKKKKEDDEKSKKDGSATDETASNSDRREEVPPTTTPKPQSAGASMRDAAQKILTLGLKGEWTAVEGVIKSLEKGVEKAKLNAEEEIHLVPLAGVHDPVTGNTPLMLAVKDNKTPLIDRLIELGSDVCARNNDNYNVLHIASMYSREDVVKTLLNKKGVDAFSTGGSRSQTAAHLVASRQTGTATSILKTILATAGKDIRVKADNVSVPFSK
ncbi:CLUMA_CG014091, isoform A [Clunio marinus]|uniref:CLUMA_CG014091, isoform A n=1 Tax=Clunio marinus TaxID=568069 RepID=A0A1J1IL03_9DIPT|nr:CLUMA_CG014091, isoform A [Clunio marinus]